MVVSSFAIGALAYPVFELGFIDTVLTIFFINLLGILPVCFFSTFGSRFGLRQMVLSRFFFGWYGVKISKLPDFLGDFLQNVLAINSVINTPETKTTHWVQIYSTSEIISRHQTVMR
jgi:hypothetical protein